jgi:MarR family transcriptional regulator, organic hydroperoxide resistance regulator
MPPPRDHKPDAAADALLAVAPLVSRWMERLLAAHRPRLTLAQYLALRAIGRESLGASELALRTGVSGPAVSQLVAGLVELGLVRRRPAAEDRRRQELTLSAAGERALSSADELMRTRLGGAIDELPRPEADALARALPTVEAILSGAAPPRRPHPRRPRGPRP